MKMEDTNLVQAVMTSALGLQASFACFKDMVEAIDRHPDQTTTIGYLQANALAYFVEMEKTNWSSMFTLPDACNTVLELALLSNRQGRMMDDTYHKFTRTVAHAVRNKSCSLQHTLRDLFMDVNPGRQPNDSSKPVELNMNDASALCEGIEMHRQVEEILRKPPAPSMKIKSRQSCTRRLQFCAGHRVMGHENKCAHLHGHNYVVYLEAEPDKELDKVGRVVDFSVLKYKIGTWIDKHWDHGFILHEHDENAIKALRWFNKNMTCDFDGTNEFTQKLFKLPYNPTAENMAKYLLEVVGPRELEGTGCHLTNVQVDETENCSANAVQMIYDEK
jgi:6-pyruvoyltetrahydropterin/6-carboxytetrahydropterin synthase